MKGFLSFSRFTSLLQYLSANNETPVTKLNAPPPLIQPQSDFIKTSRNIYLHDKQQAKGLDFIFQSSQCPVMVSELVWLSLATK